MFLLKLPIFLLMFVYTGNSVLVFGNLCKMNSENAVSQEIMWTLFATHFLIQVVWMACQIMQIHSLFFWISYMKSYNTCLLEATFVQSRLLNDIDESDDDFGVRKQLQAVLLVSVAEKLQIDHENWKFKKTDNKQSSGADSSQKKERT